jgi:hypothetical protein
MGHKIAAEPTARAIVDEVVECLASFVLDCIIVLFIEIA